ncbi:MAG: helix-turn-helix transcriptional regulator [Bacteriovoracaceae bacterium]|nr:helix-turn-helix transcriptional regulator [Bacteriovoracaceae bacterium]
MARHALSGDFWINCAGDEISRASINFLLSGKTDPRATTLMKMAKLLRISQTEIFDF